MLPTVFRQFPFSVQFSSCSTFPNKTEKLVWKKVTSHNSWQKIVQSERFEAISLKPYFSYLCSLCGMQFCECVLHQIIDFFGFSLLHLAFLPIFSMIAASKQCRLILKVLAMRGGFHSLSLPKLMRHLVTKLHSELLHTKVSSQTTQLSSHDSVLEATVVKNVEKIFAYFSKIFPDFKTGAKILWINFLPFLTWIFSCCDPFSFHQIELSGWSLICCSDAAKPSF